MKFLECLICNGFLDIIGHEGYTKIVQCQSCGFKSPNKIVKKEPEVFKRRIINRGSNG